MYALYLSLCMESQGVSDSVLLAIIYIFCGWFCQVVSSYLQKCLWDNYWMVSIIHNLPITYAICAAGQKQPSFPPANISGAGCVSRSDGRQWRGVCAAGASVSETMVFAATAEVHLCESLTNTRELNSSSITHFPNLLCLVISFVCFGIFKMHRFHFWGSVYTVIRLKCCNKSPCLIFISQYKIQNSKTLIIPLHYYNKYIIFI